MRPTVDEPIVTTNNTTGHLLRSWSWRRRRRHLPHGERRGGRRGPQCDRSAIEALMVAVLDELDLTDLVCSIQGVSAVGAAAILAEAGES